MSNLAVVPPPELPKPKIELEKQEHGWKVTWGSLYSTGLCVDEALGTVAEILYSGHARYLQTAEYWAAWEKKYGRNSEVQL